MTEKDKLKSLKLYLEVINQLYEKFENLNETELEEILSGNVSININLKSKGIKKKNVKKSYGTNNYNEIEKYLRSLENREEGRIYIETKLTGKEQFINLAKYLDLPVSKEDSIEKIKDKIIETTIGYRLRSRAIQEFGLK